MSFEHLLPTVDESQLLVMKYKNDHNKNNFKVEWKLNIVQ